jgi:branched-subunit amino acid transport protein AzlD
MPDYAYVATALGVAVAITVTLRAAPFAIKSALKNSPLGADLGRWLPLGAVTILATYCLGSIKLSGPSHGLPELAGVFTTVAYICGGAMRVGICAREPSSASRCGPASSPRSRSARSRGASRVASSSVALNTAFAHDQEQLQAAPDPGESSSRPST